MAKAWLGLGGNIGDVVASMAEAIRAIDARKDIAVTAVSRLYKTAPWGIENQPWFHNCCIELETNLTPKQLLAACQEQETNAKRERKERWGPRTLDIDIIAFEGVEQQQPALALPHPRAHERSFVTVPLAEISPDLRLGKRTARELASEHAVGELELVETADDWWRNKPA